MDLRLLYIILCLVTFGLSALFSPAYLKHSGKKKRFYIFTAVVLAATIGVFAAHDLLVLFVCFEIMSLASYGWVVFEENEGAVKASDTYMAVAVIGGLSLLAGIVLLYTVTNTLDIDMLKETCINNGLYGDPRISAAGILMFFGFGAKAGVFPVHIWLPKAHPVAPAPASALLSGVLTKTGIYGIMITGLSLFDGNKEWGLFNLVLGLITMALGACLAIFSVDLKRVLACSSVSQIGFIATGIAAAVILSENEAALDGTVIHMANHTLVKLVVFLSAGVVFENTHTLDLNGVKGFGRNKILLKIAFALGALSLAGVPGFPGYLSKTSLHEALVETAGALPSGFVTFSEWVFLISGGATLCYMLKLFICIFAQKNSPDVQAEYDLLKGSYMPVPQVLSVLLPATGLIAGGIFLSVDRFGELYEFAEMKGSLISISIGIVLYLITTVTINRGGEYRNLWPAWLDLETLVYRPLLLTVIPTVAGFFARLMDDMLDGVILILRKTVLRDSPVRNGVSEGNLFTHVVGHGADMALGLIKHTETGDEVEQKLIERSMELKEANLATQRSLSYGLMLACLGMFIMLGFILALVFIL